MKSCLKAVSLPGSPDPNHHGRKCVAFNADGSEEIHWADEWDRTPTEPAKKLSYQEILELKEIQQSLPHAKQPLDPLRPGKQLLSMVPIGLLPLASADTVVSPVSPPPQSPESIPQAPFVMPPGRARVVAPPRMASALLTHLRPPAPPPPRVKPAFSFLPLLASPSPQAPSNSNNHASAAADPGSYFPVYPPARSAADGEPDRVFPSPTRPRPIPTAGTAKHQYPMGGYEHAYRAAEAAAYSPPFGSSAYDYTRDRHDMLGDRDNARPAVTRGGPSTSPTTGRKKKRKTFMMINDEQVEIEEDDDGDEEVASPQLSLPSPSIKIEAKPPMPPLISMSPPAISTSPQKQIQTSPRLAGARPLSPVAAVSPLSARPVSPLSPASARPGSPLTQPTGRVSPVQARASSRLVRA
ncbi:hypothetical protein C8R45DRAFT_1214300 [Mycena sanguinolenta]|nr:hypothetical protein C8R45DRAFT_1214300 [Mycena sanguinolenta]